jgi:hypothetical protein
MKLLSLRKSSTIILLFSAFLCTTTYAVTLDELVEGDSTEEQSTSNGDSLLEGIEEARHARKQQAATEELNTVNEDIKQECHCVQKGNCNHEWNVGPWTFAYDDFADIYRRLFDHAQNLCRQAKFSSEDASQKELNEAAKLNKDIAEKLGKIRISMRMDSYDLKRRYEEDKQQRIADEKWERIQEESARIDAEVEAAWRDDPVGISDAEFEASIDRTYDSTMDDIRYAEQRAFQQKLLKQQNKTNQNKQTIAKSDSSDDILEDLMGSSNSTTANSNTVNKTETKSSGRSISFCPSGNGNLVGPIEEGNYCFTFSNKEGKQCDSMPQSSLDRKAMSHCGGDLTYKMRNSGALQASQYLKSTGYTRKSCECGISEKYGNPLCKSHYVFTCALPKSSGGNSETISK